jgi:thiosulfate/3-mercaptopyruvate sulfurtransferase
VAYTTLVDLDALRHHLDDPAWLVVDCRHSLQDFALGRRLYGESHVPGAFFADVERDLSGVKTGTNGRHPLPDPAVFASFLEGLGARDETQIVAYDAGGDMFAARLWFLCRWIGHDSAAVLDGGFAAWTAAGHPVTTQLPHRRERGSLTLRLRPELVVDAAFVHMHINDPSICIVDARAADRFAGFNETMDPVAGHIPGARNRPFKENFAADLRWKSPESLREAFAEFGSPERVVHQCGSGVSAAANHLAMEHAGLRGSRVYAGSWSEWISDPARPVERASAATRSESPQR